MDSMTIFCTSRPEVLPLNAAFWSLTLTNPQRHIVNNSINRYSVGDRSNLVSNADGSIDIYLQNTAPVGKEANWLPATTDDFMLWLRVYQPEPAILNGEYHVPPVVGVK